MRGEGWGSTILSPLHFSLFSLLWLPVRFYWEIKLFQIIIKIHQIKSLKSTILESGFPEVLIR